MGSLPMLRRALAGEFAAVPYAAGGPPPTLPAGAVPDAGTALVVATSGSTGAPKLAMLPATALAASAAATHERLGGPGSWLLAMPPHHIAGVQVLLRALAAGTTPGFVDLGRGFTAAAFTRAARRLQRDERAPRRYTSLVPTQLLRLLDDPEAATALAQFDGVLVGGAACPPALVVRARTAGVAVTLTYGMSETSGGCVYDGTPLTGVTVRADEDGRVHLGGDTLASGYLGDPGRTAQAFVTDATGRWFRTDDAGHQDPSGCWHVDGRLDDVITTGGLKVAPRLVEDALVSLPGVAEAVVVAVPDPQWGQVVAAALVTTAGQHAEPPLTVSAVRESLRGILPAHALPRRLLVLDELPLRGPGKPDRGAVAVRFAAGHDTMG